MTKKTRKRKVISDGKHTPAMITSFRMLAARMRAIPPCEATKMLKRQVNSQASVSGFNGSGMRGMLALLEERPSHPK